MKRVLIVMFASTLLLAACGGSDSEGSGSSAEFNDADVAFAQGMIPHHEQAVEMADLALENADSDEVTSLAEEIKAAQDPEIETMEGWLDDWGQSDSGAPDTRGMMGMMSDQEMAELEVASGAEFDEMFLKMMVEHHTGAISMAATEQADGENGDAKALAGQIIEAQKAEIAEMEALLDGGV